MILQLILKNTDIMEMEFYLIIQVNHILLLEMLLKML